MTPQEQHPSSSSKSILATCKIITKLPLIFSFFLTVEFRVCGGWSPNSPRGLHGRDCQSWSLQRGGRRQQKGRNPAEGMYIWSNPSHWGLQGGAVCGVQNILRDRAWKQWEGLLDAVNNSSMSWLLARAIDGSIHIMLLFPILSAPYQASTTPKYLDHIYTKLLLFSLFIGHGPVLLWVFEKAWEQLLITADLCSQELTKTWQMHPAETAWHV